jgi:hypothetical protein
MRMMKQWLRRGFMLPAAAICVLSVPVTAAHAALVTYSFAGNIDGDPSGFLPISGSFQIDNANGGSGGVYNGAVRDFTFEMRFNGDILYTSSFKPGANAVAISQNIPMGGGSGDRWELVSAASGDPLPGGSRPFSFDLHLDRIGGGLNPNVLDPPSLGSLNGGSARWRLLFADENGIPGAWVGSISGLTAVPLPAAVLLFGAGLISLVGLGAGGLRNLRGAKA